MSFSIEFTARSRSHALQMLETHKAHLPAPVFDYLAIAINNLPPTRDGFMRAVHVKAHGHLCSGPGWSPCSTAQIEVRPIEIPD